MKTQTEICASQQDEDFPPAEIAEIDLEDENFLNEIENFFKEDFDNGEIQEEIF